VIRGTPDAETNAVCGRCGEALCDCRDVDWARQSRHFLPLRSPSGRTGDRRGV